jgi:hypothetical protein
METELTTKSRKDLADEAKSMGLKFHPALGVKKLQKLIDDAKEKAFDEEQYRLECEKKLRIEAEAKAKIELEMKPHIIGKKDRKPSPEEVITKTHPKVDIEFQNADGTDVPLHCTWGGVTYVMFPGKYYQVPYGFADHLQFNCQYPRYEQVPNPDAPGTFMPKRVGWKPRFNIRPIDNLQFAQAEEKAKEMDYIPIRERKQVQE